MKRIIVTSLALSMSLFSLTAKSEDMRPYLKIDQAWKGLAACKTLADSKGWNMAVVIIDRGLDVVGSFRMDGALPPAYKGATLKAETALSWSMSTVKVGEFVGKNPEFKQFPGLLPIGGGEAIFSESGKLIAAVGVAGGYVKHDEECAKAVVDAIQ